MSSLWVQTSEPPQRCSLSEDLRADVIIIGAGMVGITTAYFLQRQGLHVIILDAGDIGSGQTGNTTAKLTSQHGLIYTHLIQHFGRDMAKQYADANERALQDYLKIIQEQEIHCHYQEVPAYLYTLEDPDPLRHEAVSAGELGLRADFTTDTELPFPVTGAVRFDGQAQFHPLEFLYALTSDLEIYTHTPVLNVDAHIVYTPQFQVQGDTIVFASHFPFINTPGYYFMRMHQERSYVIAYRNVQPMEGMYLGVDPQGLSFRSYGDYMLLGGESHRTGENSAGSRYEGLRQQARTFWPQAQEMAAWSAQDCITLDGIPYIGRFSASMDTWYVATGFGKWGMSTSMVAARLLTDQIIGKKNPYETLFSPQRHTLSDSAVSLIEESLQSMKGLARHYFMPPREEIAALEAGRGGIVSCDGDKMGVYKDLEGETWIVSIRCPHLGCQLEWNPDEKSWDCPCHGSRFDYKGRLLNGPAQDNLATE